jgi:hypothetical protein
VTDGFQFATDPTPLKMGRISAQANPSYLVSVPAATEMPWLEITPEGTLSGGPDPHGYIAQYTPFVQHLPKVMAA